VTDLLRLRLLLALSLGLNMGLLGFVVGHFLLPENPPPQTSRPAPGPSTAGLLAEIDQELAEEQWDAAVARCRQLKTAARERAAKTSFEAAHAAMVQHHHREAIALLGAIPQNSVYRRRAEGTLADARKRYATLARSEVAARVREGECDAARQLVAEMKLVLLADKDGEPLGDCDPAVTMQEEDMSDTSPRATRPKTHRGAKAAPTKPTAKAKVEAVPDAKPDRVAAARLLKEAQEAYVSGHHSQAIVLGHQALKADPGSKQALQIIAASSCYQKDGRRARWAYQRLSGQTRGVLRAVCSKAGINLE
jgi:hypothetical protein